MILGSQIITKQSTVKKLDLEGGPSWVQAFLGGSCILGLGLVGVRFRVRISVSIWGRVRVSFVCVHLGVGLGFGSGLGPVPDLICGQILLPLPPLCYKLIGALARTYWRI